MLIGGCGFADEVDEGLVEEHRLEGVDADLLDEVWEGGEGVAEAVRVGGVFFEQFDAGALWASGDEGEGGGPVVPVLDEGAGEGAARAGVFAGGGGDGELEGELEVALDQCVGDPALFVAGGAEALLAEVVGDEEGVVGRGEFEELGGAGDFVAALGGEGADGDGEVVVVDVVGGESAGEAAEEFGGPVWGVECLGWAVRGVGGKLHADVLSGVGVLVFQPGVLGVGCAEARGLQGLFEHRRDFGGGEGGFGDAVDGVERRGVRLRQEIERGAGEVLNDAEVFGLAAEGHWSNFQIANYQMANGRQPVRCLAEAMVGNQDMAGDSAYAERL